MDASVDSGPRIALIEGEAVIHQRFGGAGPSERKKTARETAHGALMQCTPVPKCVDGAGMDGVAHTLDCDHATGLIEQLRTLLAGRQAQG